MFVFKTMKTKCYVFCPTFLNASRCRMTCQRRAGSAQSVQDGLPDPAAGVFTDSCRHQSLHHGLRPHDCCSGKTRSGISVARYRGDTVPVRVQPLCQGALLS